MSVPLHIVAATFRIQLDWAGAKQGCEKGARVALAGRRIRSQGPDRGQRAASRLAVSSSMSSSTSGWRLPPVVSERLKDEPTRWSTTRLSL